MCFLGLKLEAIHFITCVVYFFFQVLKCSGICLTPLKTWHFDECQPNLNILINDENRSIKYCPKLCGLLDNASTVKKIVPSLASSYPEQKKDHSQNL
jgi:hypothetical protein